MLETQRILDNSTNPPTYKASLTITARPGPRPMQIDIHRVRVDDAARELDTMGPPIVSLTASTGGWVVTTASDQTLGTYIASVTGTDAPAGSWKRVWYRATAWTALDQTRGALPGRSDASPATFVVLPPPDPPVLSPLLIGTGPGAADVILQWTCPLHAHRSGRIKSQCEQWQPGRRRNRRPDRCSRSTRRSTSSAIRSRRPAPERGSSEPCPASRPTECWSAAP